MRYLKFYLFFGSQDATQHKACSHPIVIEAYASVTRQQLLLNIYDLRFSFNDAELPYGMCNSATMQ